MDRFYRRGCFLALLAHPLEQEILAQSVNGPLVRRSRTVHLIFKW